MSKISSKQKYECCVLWLEWIKKDPNYKKYVRPRKQHQDQ